MTLEFEELKHKEAQNYWIYTFDTLLIEVALQHQICGICHVDHTEDRSKRLWGSTLSLPHPLRCPKVVISTGEDCLQGRQGPFAA